MSNLNNGGLTRVLNYIKTWVNGLLSGKSDTSHTHTKSQITDFPSIPSKTSQLTNDSGYLTSHQSLSNYLDKSTAQTISAFKIGKGNSTAGFAAQSADGTYRATLMVGSGGCNRGIWDDYLQMWIVYANDTACYLNGTATKATYNANGKELVNSIIKGLSISGRTITYTKLDGSTGTLTTQDTTYTIPTKTSQLTNDSGYITSTVTSLTLKVKDTNSSTQRTNPVIQGNSSNVDYGINSCFGTCSNTIVGAGEGKDSLLSTLAGNADETLYLISDGDIYFHPNAQTFANRKTIILNTSGALTGLSNVSTSNVTVTNNSSNGVLFGSYRVYVG